MRIALSFPACHLRGGVERVLVECANFLSRRDHSVAVFASDFDDVLDTAIERHRVSVPRIDPLWRLVMFPRRSRNEIDRARPPFDVIAGFGALAPPGAVVWVQSVHRAWIETSRKNRLAKRVRQALNPAHLIILQRERRYYQDRQYGRLIALTDQVKADLNRYYKVPSADVDILPNGYQPKEFNVLRCREDRAATRVRLGYGPGDRVIMFAANELERKGFFPLLDAVARLDQPDVHLLVVGKVSPETCVAAIRRTRLGGRVQFVGPSGDIAAMFGAADLFALPTQYEAWGLVVVEALACGLPVLTSRLAGAAIAVHEGETGELLDSPYDVDEIAAKLKVLLCRRTNPEFHSQSVAAYAWNTVLEAYEEILERQSSANAHHPRSK